MLPRRWLTPRSSCRGPASARQPSCLGSRELELQRLRRAEPAAQLSVRYVRRTRGGLRRGRFFTSEANCDRTLDASSFLALSGARPIRRHRAGAHNNVQSSRPTHLSCLHRFSGSCRSAPCSLRKHPVPGAAARRHGGIRRCGIASLLSPLQSTQLGSGNACSDDTRRSRRLSRSPVTFGASLFCSPPASSLPLVSRSLRHEYEHTPRSAA